MRKICVRPLCLVKLSASIAAPEQVGIPIWMLFTISSKNKPSP